MKPKLTSELLPGDLLCPRGLNDFNDYGIVIGVAESFTNFAAYGSGPLIVNAMYLTITYVNSRTSQVKKYVSLKTTMHQVVSFQP